MCCALNGYVVFGLQKWKWTHRRFKVRESMNHCCATPIGNFADPKSSPFPPACAQSVCLRHDRCTTRDGLPEFATCSGYTRQTILLYIHRSIERCHCVPQNQKSHAWRRFVPWRINAYLHETTFSTKIYDIVLQRA